jgi:hypothetical protein
MGDEKRCMQLFGGETSGKRPLRRPRHIWEDNIKLDIQEVGWMARTGSIWLRIGTGGRHL